MAAKRKKTDPKLAKLYAIAKREFTAADLQKYTVETPTVPAVQVIAELETLYKKDLKNRHRRKSA